jgi:hypothetical protein
MFSVLETLSKDQDVTITDLKHAYRINGVIDLWKNKETVYDIVSNKYETIKDDKAKLAWAIEKINTHPKREPFKKTTKGRVSYQEFKHSLHQEAVNLNGVYGEDYHWKRNVDKIGEDDLYILVHYNTAKIGRSKDPQKRVKVLETAISGEYEMYVFKGKGFIEATLHSCFEKLSLNGEWFQFRTNNRISLFIQRYFKKEGCYKLSR